MSGWTFRLWKRLSWALPYMPLPESGSAQLPDLLLFVVNYSFLIVYAKLFI